MRARKRTERRENARGNGRKYKEEHWAEREARGQGIVEEVKDNKTTR